MIKGVSDQVATTINYNYDYELIPIKNGDTEKIKIQTEFMDQLEAPIEQNTEIGKMHVIVENKEIMSISILIKEKIDKKSIWSYVYEILGSYTVNLEKIAKN